jgi:hypothetical protein
MRMPEMPKLPEMPEFHQLPKINALEAPTFRLAGQSWQSW